MPMILLRGANLLDCDAGIVLPDRNVLIEGERIVEVQEGEIRRGDAHVIDCGGRTLMPGLIDAHVHAVITTMNFASLAQRPASLIALQAARLLEGMLQRGFTSVRDAAGADAGLAQAIEQGLVAGPRLFYSGRALSQTGGHGDVLPRPDEPLLCACQIRSNGIAHVADGVDAVRRAAREELRRGAHQIKIMASGGVASPSDPIWNVQYSAGEMRAIVEEAEGWHTYALAHAYTPEAIGRAIDAGVRTIEHGNLIDETTALRVKQAGAFLVPTLVTYFAIDEMGRALGFPKASQDKVRDVLDAGLASLEIAKRVGLPMGFGTDLLGETHEQQSREFSLRARVLSPAEILRSATRVNAEILRRTDELGVIAPGALADVILVDGDPLQDLSLLEGQGKHLPLIMKGGRIFVNRLR